MHRALLALLFVTASCGGQNALTPEDVGRLTFNYLKNNDFTGYFTTLVATPAIVVQTCPGLAGIDRYFDTGEGGQQPQQDRFLTCRMAIDFTNAVYVGTTVVPQTSELVPPACNLPIDRADAVVTVRVGTDSYYFTVTDVTHFVAGWRVYKRINNCGTTPP
jgi:hypothetical protein